MNTSEKILGLLRKSKEIKSGNDYWIDLGTVTEKDMDMLAKVSNQNFL